MILVGNVLRVTNMTSENVSISRRSNKNRDAYQMLSPDLFQQFGIEPAIDLVLMNRIAICLKRRN